MTTLLSTKLCQPNYTYIWNQCFRHYKIVLTLLSIVILIEFRTLNTLQNVFYCVIFIEFRTLNPLPLESQVLHGKFPEKKRPNPDVLQHKTICIPRRIIPQNFSSSGLGVRERTNKETEKNTHTNSLTSYCFR